MTTEPHHGVQAPGPGAAGRKPAKRAASPASGTDSYFADLRSLYDELLSHRLADQARTVDAALVALANAQPEDRLEVAMRAFFGLSSTDRRWILMALTDTLPSVLAHRRGQLLALIESRWGDAEIFTPPTPTRSAQ